MRAPPLRGEWGLQAPVPILEAISPDSAGLGRFPGPGPEAVGWDGPPVLVTVGHREPGRSADRGGGPGLEPLSSSPRRSPAPLPAPSRRLRRDPLSRSGRAPRKDPSPASPARPTTRSRRRYVAIRLRAARVSWLPVGGPGVVHTIYAEN